jgi:hypothetical protein
MELMPQLFHLILEKEKELERQRSEETHYDGREYLYLELPQTPSEENSEEESEDTNDAVVIIQL